MKQSVFVAVLLMLSVILSGCWDHHPPEDTAFILMIGLDVDPDIPEQTVVTQLAVLSGGVAAGENTGQQEGTPFYLLSNSGYTLEGAQLAVLDHLSRLPRLDHMDALIMSEELARKGDAVEPAIAWALRHPQIRPGIFLFVAEESAQQFLDARPALDPLPGAALAGLMRDSDRVSHILPTRAFEFAQTMLSPRIDGAIPIVRRINPLSTRVPPDFQQQPFVGSTSEGGKGGSSDPMKTQIKLVGMAIFKGSTMVGSMMREDAQGLAWIRGDNKSMLSIEHPEHSGNYIAALTIRSGAKRQARLEDDERVVLTIEVTASMDVWGEGIMEPMGISRQAKGIEQELTRTIEKQVRRTMQLLQQMKADIFGFGEELYRRSPKDWDKVSDRWDALYRDAELDVKAQVTVRRTGLSR